MAKSAPPDKSDISLAQYFEGSTDLYCVLGFDGIFIHVNPAWNTILGYDPSELVGHPYTDFVHPDDLDISKEKFHDPDPPDRGSFKNRYRHKSGHYISLLWSGHQDVPRTRVSAHARNVTNDARRASLLRSVARIQDIYLNHDDKPIDLFHRILHEVISVAESKGGFIAELDEVAKSSVPRLVASKNLDTDKIENLVRATVSRNRISNFDSIVCIPLSYLGNPIAVIGLDGQMECDKDIEFIDLLKPVLEATSSVIGLFQASRRELELRERFSVIVENLPLMLTEFGPEGHVTWANRFYREKIGWTEADFLSRDLITDNVATPDGDTNEPERAREFMLSGRTDWQDFILKNSKGEWFPSTWTNVRLSDGRAIGIGQDLTDRQAAEAKMIQSSKMASLGEMSAGVSHEINNPLTIIQGSAFRAIQNLNDAANSKNFAATDEIEGDLNRIIQNCDRIARIVRGLRAFSRTDEHEPFMPTLLVTIVDDVLNLASERFRSHAIELSVDIDTSISLDCRPVLLGQVLMNLLNNAFDAVVESKRLPRKVKIKAVCGSDGIDIFVEDNGPGIPLAIRNRILDPFFTTKDVGKGTGLGLSISKGIVESHSGHLLFDSSDAGTRFVVRLPIRQRIDAGL